MTSVGDMDLWREKDGRKWRIGSDTEVPWIRDHTLASGIAWAIPPVFETYATLELPVLPNGRGGWARRTSKPLPQWLVTPNRHDAAVLAVLEEHTAPQPWWLGYLDKDASGIDTVFDDVPKV